MNIFYYTYKIIHVPSGLFYIGRRIYHGLRTEDDRYMGSGIKLKRLMKAHPSDSFQKTVTGIFDSPKAMILAERSQIEESFLDPYCLNLCIGDGRTIGIVKHHPESRIKTSRSVLGDANPMFGKKHNDETKRKMAEAKSGKIAMFRDGRMIKVPSLDLSNFIDDGWVPGVKGLKKVLELLPSAKLSVNDCDSEVKKWRIGSRVSKSRVDRTTL